MNPDQPEAGPSTPRTATPPSTPKTASRRRSWFGFGGSPFTASSTSVSGSPRRKSFAPDEGGEGEGHELVDRSLGAVKEPTTPVVGARRSSLQVVHDSKEEVLTIDGEVETPGSVRRRKKSRSHGVDEEQGEVVRLDDLSLRKKGKVKMGLWQAEDSPGAQIEGLPPKVRENGPSPIHPKVSPPKPPKPDLSIPIPSSPRLFSLSIPSIRVPPDKVTPPLPTERPLPALPTDSPSTRSPTLIPTDIVITPSSPRKLQKPKSDSHTRRTSSSMTDLRAARHTNGDHDGRPRTSGSFRSSSKPISRKSSMIGLGLPRGLGDGEMQPPPVPHKTQSVSSPHPSRSASPVPKISFAEPEDEKERGRTEKGDEKKEKVKRARSLSGIFNRSASQPVPSKPGSVVNGDASEELLVEQDQENVEIGKMAGVLEWLGVRRAGKRRMSDAKAIGMGHIEAKRDSAGEEGVPSDPFKRPDMRTVSSSTTVMPSTTLKGLSADKERIPGAIAIPSRPSASSLNFPTQPESNVPSPKVDTPTSFVSSPTTETEEMFFDPPSAPWVDGTEAPRSPATVAEAKAAAIVGKDGRLRSWSDAPTPSPHLVQSSPMADSSPDQTPSQPPSSFGTRPKMGNRSHSGNSAIIEKMKGVFTKSSARNRSRSKSLLPQANGEAGEFGGLGDRDRAGTGSSASLSSQQWSPAPPPNASSLDLHGRPADGMTHSTPPTSYTPSVIASAISETAPGSSVKPAKARGRASTVSFASSAPQTSFLPPPPPISPSLFPISGTPPRRRPSAIQRFSSGLLGSSAPSSPKGSLFPLPPRSSGSTFSSGGAGDDAQSAVTSLLMSPGASPRPSNASGQRTGWKVDIKVEEGETAEAWLERMVACVGRDDIAGVLASSGDEFHARALELYMADFDFTHNALDVALRRLLMQISLPKETQQIDRVLEAFAKRYEACEPGLFGSKGEPAADIANIDNTYVLAFSMMMLHTDAFNRNNKNKMSKADYVRNTRMEGVSPITLEAFYDNITYTPFVHFDADSDVPVGSLMGRSRSGSDAITPMPSPTPAFLVGSPVTPATGLPNGTPSSASTLNTTPRRAATPTSTLSVKQPDVYALIAQNNLASLRVDVERSIPAGSPFSCLGTKPFLEMGKMQNAFVGAGILKIGGSPAGARKAGTVGKKRAESDSEGATVNGDTDVALRVTKVGTLSRKDDSLDANRKTSRKWKSWSVILTGSQLLFFKDPFWALSLQEQMKADNASKRDEKGQVLLPRVARFVPDEVFPVKDAVAVLDKSLIGHPHTFRFHLPNRAYLIQASDESEMNEWIGLINYAAAFKSSAIRMRAGSMRKDQALLAGAAAASSLKRESKSLDAVGDEGPKGRKRFGSLTDDTPPIAINGRGPPSILSVRNSGDSQRQRARTPDRSDTSSPVSGRNARASVESESAVVSKDDGERLGEVFRAVKAELAAEPGIGLGLVNGGKTRAGLRVRIPSSQAVRSTAIETSIRNLSIKLSSAQSKLDTYLIQARNLAILTPFQRTTRDRISGAVPPLATKIRDERLASAKWSLWISILQCDLDREEKEWEGTRQVAMQGAKRSLRDEEGVRGVVQDVASALEAGEASKVRFVGENGDVANGDQEEGTEEVLTDTPIGVRSSGSQGIDASGGTASLGTTPQELPVLFRPSSEEKTPQLADVGRPGMRRHVSASLLQSGRE